MLTTALVLLADLAIGALAYRLSKSNEKQLAQHQQTDASLLTLLAKHSDKLDNHEVRIGALERAA
jgi:hypothetical protein